MPAWHQRVRPCKSLISKGSPARNERFEFGRHRWGANRPPAASGLAPARFGAVGQTPPVADWRLGSRPANSTTTERGSAR